MGFLQTLSRYLQPTPVLTPTAGQQTQAITKALHEPEFRQQLLTNTEGALRSLKIPVLDHQTITVMEAKHGQIFFVIPVMTAKEAQQLQAALHSDLPQRAARARVLLQAAQDADYKAQLLAHPQETLTAAGIPIPALTSVTVLENSAAQIYWVLPHLHQLGTVRSGATECDKTDA